MFEIVKTNKQQKEFAQLWEYNCKKYGWINDPYSENGIRYLLVIPTVDHQERKVIGTVEFIPYHPENEHSTVENRIKFSSFPEIASNLSKVWEIDKLCLHDAYQRRGYFQLFFHVFYDHVRNHHPIYYIALMEQRFFRMLRISFGFRIEQKAKPFIGEYENSLVPIAFNVKNIGHDKQRIEELLSKDAKLLRKERITKTKPIRIWKRFYREFKRLCIKLKNRLNNKRDEHC